MMGATNRPDSSYSHLSAPAGSSQVRRAAADETEPAGISSHCRKTRRSDVDSSRGRAPRVERRRPGQPGQRRRACSVCRGATRSPPAIRDDCDRQSFMGRGGRRWPFREEGGHRYNEGSHCGLGLSSPTPTQSQGDDLPRMALGVTQQSRRGEHNYRGLTIEDRGSCASVAFG